jgi:hypothetical protein
MTHRSPLDCVSCARCVLDPNGLLGNSVGQWQDGRRPSRPCSAIVSLDVVGTLFARVQTHDIAKLAIRPPGLADAGSVDAIQSPPMRGPYGVLRADRFRSTSKRALACLRQLRKELSAIWSDRPRYAKVEAALIESGQR